MQLCNLIPCRLLLLVVVIIIFLIETMTTGDQSCAPEASVRYLLISESAVKEGFKFSHWLAV